MEYYARRADACIVEQLESTAALLQQEKAGSRYELYLIELPAANPCSGLQAAAELRRRGVRAPLAFLAHTTAYAYEAFRVDAMQYLHIPFRPEQLTALLDRATEPEYGPVIPVATAMGLLRFGAEKMSFDPIVVSGPNGSLPHGIPSAKQVHPPCGALPPCQRRGRGLPLPAGALFRGGKAPAGRCPFSAAPPLLCGQPCRRRPALLRGALDAQRGTGAHPPGA